MTRLQLRPDLEEATRQLPGVRAASVVTDADAAPIEIHVVADPIRSAKQVVRDIQSLALAQFGLEIDHRIVSVVQVGPALLDVAVVTNARPRIEAIEWRSAGSELSVRVTIANGEHQQVGEATGNASATTRPRLVADATARAVTEWLETPPVVEHASITEISDRSFAIVFARVGERLCVGSALIRDDEIDALVRATLDALNRQLRAS